MYIEVQEEGHPIAHLLLLWGDPGGMIRKNAKKKTHREKLRTQTTTYSLSSQQPTVLLFLQCVTVCTGLYFFIQFESRSYYVIQNKFRFFQI